MCVNGSKPRRAISRARQADQKDVLEYAACQCDPVDPRLGVQPLGAFTDHPCHSNVETRRYRTDRASVEQIADHRPEYNSLVDLVIVHLECVDA